MNEADFIALLKKYCGERIVGEIDFYQRQAGKDEAYRDVIQLINVYQREKNNESNAA